MKRESRKIFVFLVAVLACGLVLFTVGCGQDSSVKQEEQKKTSETGSFVKFANEKYGYTISHPADWNFELAGETAGDEYATVVFGNPITGQKIYTMTITVRENPNGYTSKEWAEKVSDNTYAEGPETMTYESAKDTKVGGQDAYMLYGVFSFDRSDEVIYVAHDKYVYEISFPIAAENPNLADPVANNEVVYKMLETFTFTK
jgi:hypothetical protein